jgi:hypothetical protein
VYLYLLGFVLFVLWFFFNTFVYVYLFLFVLSVLVEGLPPNNNNNNNNNNVTWGGGSRQSSHERTYSGNKHKVTVSQLVF